MSARGTTAFGSRRATTGYWPPWAGAAAAVVVFAALGWLLAADAYPAQHGAPALATLIGGVGFAAAALVPALGRLLLGPARIASALSCPDAELARRHLLAGHLVLCSAAVLPALLGFAQLLAGGRPAAHLLLCAAALALLAWLTPAEARVAARLDAVLRAGAGELPR